MAMVTLEADARYGCSGQYIARLTGRDSTKTFRREFVGRKVGKRGETTRYETDEPGLYEICRVERSGKQQSYAPVLSWGGKLEEYTCSKEDAMKIARLMDEGRPFDQIIRGGETCWAWVEGPGAESAAAAEAAVDQCLAILRALPADQAQAARAALRGRLEDATPDA